MPALDAHPSLIATTTAWGRGKSLDVGLSQIAARTNSTCVELSIGSRPVEDPESLLERYASRFTYLAHHSAPVLAGEFLRPETHSPAQAVSALQRLGISRYTIHPPTKRQVPTNDAFLDWAWSWFDTLGAAGIDVRLETMYVPRDRKETALVGAYHLDSAASTLEFARAANARGIATPLLVDLSHLYIGLCSKGWTALDVQDLLHSGLSDHLHVSANDGRRDLHVPVPDAHPIMEWVNVCWGNFSYVVDEGRRDIPVSLLQGA